MNIREAVKYLEKYEITSSEQVLRRWIRQGKIKATMRSKKEGYQVSRGSLQHFIRKRLGLSSLSEWIDITDFEKEIERLKRENYWLRSEYNRVVGELKKKRVDEFYRTGGRSHFGDGFEVRNKNVFGTPQETKDVFKKLFHYLHPDKGGDAELFAKVNKAYREMFRNK